MPRKLLDRRALLRGIVGGAPVAIALPALEAMMNDHGTGFAQAGVAAPPRRFGIWYFGGGVVNDRFYPSGTGTGWTPSPNLMPLAPFRDHVTVVSGTDMKVGGKAHNSHRAYSVCNSWYDRGDGYGDPKHASLDQIVASAWNGQTKLRSIEMGVSHRQSYSYASAYGPGGAAIAPEYSPKRIFERLFSSGIPTSADAAAQPLYRSHQSVLDAVQADAKRLGTGLGASDRARIDAHLEAVRAIERQFQAPAVPATPTAGACVKPAATTSAGTGDIGHEDLEGTGRLMADLLTMALACDLVRVFNFRFTPAQTMTIFWQVGATAEEHPMTHGDQGGGWPTVGPKITTFTMQQLAYLVQKLKSTPEGAGTLLDNVLMYVTTEFLDAPTHSFNNHPMLLIGRGGGTVKAGQHIAAPGENMAKVGFACLKAMGLNVPGWGAPDRACYATAPLAGILA